MQPSAVSSGSTWCGNFQHAQQVAVEGAQWLFSCLPCVKGHHRIHPTNLESSDALYIVVDAKKRLRVLHIVPDLTNIALTVTSGNTDQVDSGDRCSLDSAGEDYWFMRWNRPIRPNLQRNFCNCSFRKSQIKSKSDGKESKSIDCHNGSIVLSVLGKKVNLHETVKNKATEGGLHNLAETMSRNILVEAVLKSCEMKISVDNPLTNTVDSSSKCCDKLGIESMIKESEVEFCGYVNPVFLASNDALDLIPSDKTLNDSCDNQFSGNKSNTFEKDQDCFFKENQDYNANDQNQHTFEGNPSMKPSIHIMKENTRSVKEDNCDKKKHRKSCLAGSKGQIKKPLLLLIHGAGSNCEVWKNLISHLVKGGYECVAPDLLGHGLSSAPDHASSYKFHAFLQDLLCIFDRFVAEGRTAVILGHGYGCSLAAAIARYRPEQVIQLVLISGGGPTPLAPRTQPPVSPCLRACLEPLLMCGFKRDVVYSVCGKQMEPCSPETSGVPRHIVEHISQGHVWPEGDASFHRRIVAPTLLVHGMKDQHITLVQECEMERTIPRSFLEVIPEAGHWAMLETPSHLSHMILCFIDWWAPPNRTQ